MFAKDLKLKWSPLLPGKKKKKEEEKRGRRREEGEKDKEEGKEAEE